MQSFIEGLKQNIQLLLEVPDQPSYSEHELLKALDFSEHESISAEKNAMSALFTKHFLLMHCVYSLRNYYSENNLGHLSVSPLSIQFTPLSDAKRSEVSQEHENQVLADYYLDLANLRNESEESIQEMLGEFWHKFATQYVITDEELAHALTVMDFEALPNLAELRRRYRELASRCHPDKGGSEEAFVDLQRAYEQILTRV